MALFPARMHGFVTSEPRGGGATHRPLPALAQSRYPDFPATPSRLMPSSHGSAGKCILLLLDRGCAVERIELLWFSPRTTTRLEQNELAVSWFPSVRKIE